MSSAANSTATRAATPPSGLTNSGGTARAPSSTSPFEPMSALGTIHHPRTSGDSPQEVMRSLIQRHLISTLARHTGSATPRDWWVATVLALRDTIHERMIATQAVHNAQNVRRIYYFSLEYLMGRLFGNNLIATGLTDV